MTVLSRELLLIERRAKNVPPPISAKTILVATGGHPMIPKLPGSEHLISSNECFQLEELPASIAIVGATMTVLTGSFFVVRSSLFVMISGT